MDVWDAAARALASVPLTQDALHQRFTSITLPPNAKLSTKSAERRKNARSNRYSNILPFDHNRVKVRAHVAEGGRGEYINASLIHVRFSPLRPHLACVTACVVHCCRLVNNASTASSAAPLETAACVLQEAPGDPQDWRFIATQGPLEHTMRMFWHMVVEQRCSAVVMLTECSEGVASKCFQYFPSTVHAELQVRFTLTSCWPPKL